MWITLIQGGNNPIDDFDRVQDILTKRIKDHIVIENEFVDVDHLDP